MPIYVVGSWRDNIVAKLIAKITGSDGVRHCALYDSDRGYVSESADGGVHIEVWEAWLDGNNLTRAIMLDASLDDAIRAAMVQRHRMHRDAPYDVPGLLRFLVRYVRLWTKDKATRVLRKRFHDRAFFCSEWVVGILQETPEGRAVFPDAPESYNAIQTLDAIAEMDLGRDVDDLRDLPDCAGRRFPLP